MKVLTKWFMAGWFMTTSGKYLPAGAVLPLLIKWRLVYNKSGGLPDGMLSLPGMIFYNTAFPDGKGRQH